MLAMPAPSRAADAITRVIDGSPTLTKNSEMPTTSAQIKNDTMVGNTGLTVSDGNGAACMPTKCMVQMPIARNAAAPASSTRWLTPGVPRIRAVRPKPV